MDRTTETLRTALSALYEDRTKIEEAISALEKLVGEDLRPTPSQTTTSSGSGASNDELTLADYARAVLRDYGGNMTTREVADELTARGQDTGSKNFYNSVYSALRRSDDIRQTDDNKWTLKGEDDASNSAEPPEGQSHPATSEA